MLRQLLNPRFAGLGLVAAAALFASAASADIHGGALTILAVAEDGDQATFTIEPPSGVGSWIWSSSDLIEMRSPKTGDLIATINPNGEETLVQYIDDPVITLAFVIQNNIASPIAVTITSALLSFAPLAAEGRATVGMSATDSNGDGVTMTGIGDPNGSMGAYLAQYNGFAGTLSGTTFAELIPGLSAGAFDTDTQNVSLPPVGFQTIPGTVSDMSVMISFTLTGFDQVSGTSTYVIQQRPVPVENATWTAIKNLTH